MEVFDVSGSIPERTLAATHRALAAGGLVVLPTDTVYGVAVRPEVAGATGRAFEVKGRPRDLTLPVLCADPDSASQVAVFDRRARALTERFWPGPMTVVLPRTQRSAGWDLGEERHTVGVRVPDHAIPAALLGRTGPLAVTSANLSGQPTPPDCDGVRAALGDAVAVYLCAGRCAGAPSTVVDLTGPEPVITRAGAVGSADIGAALRA